MTAAEDLIGKRVGLWAFQVTMSVLAKGDLKSYYGVPWEDIQWITQHAEEIDWLGKDLPVQRAPEGVDLADMLLSGEIDAYIHPHPTEIAQLRSPLVRRLFLDPEEECRRYFQREQYYPIMHILIVKEERVRARPSLPRELMQLWEDAKSASKEFYADPGYSLIAFARTQYERQDNLFGGDPWRTGLSANRANLEQFMRYMVDQTLLREPLPIESLFHPSALDT